MRAGWTDMMIRLLRRWGSSSRLRGDATIGGLARAAGDGGEERGATDRHDPRVLAGAAGHEAGAGADGLGDEDRLAGAELVRVEHDV